MLESLTSELRLVNAPISESSSLIDATTVDLFPVVRQLKVPISASSSFTLPTIVFAVVVISLLLFHYLQSPFRVNQPYRSQVSVYLLTMR